jgi:hypothetical protein
MTKNKNNEKFFTYIDGTANMSTSLFAPVIATKGHFYQISDTLGATVPPIRRHGSTEVMTTDPDRDDTFLAIESISGMTLKAFQRL